MANLVQFHETRAGQRSKESYNYNYRKKIQIKDDSLSFRWLRLYWFCNVNGLEVHT